MPIAQDNPARPVEFNVNDLLLPTELLLHTPVAVVNKGNYSIVGRGMKCGVAANKNPPKTKQFMRALEMYPDLANFDLPPRGGIAEMTSFDAHAQALCLETYEPTPMDFIKATAYVKQKYPVAPIPGYFVGHHHTVTAADVERMFDEVKGVSHPGIPWAEYGRTKTEVWTFHQDQIVEAVLRRLDILGSHDLSAISDPVQLVEIRAVDPIRLFVKKEPHSLKKLNEKRYRLVHSCSLVDELVTRLLFHNQVNMELENYQNIPSKPGMGVSVDDHAIELYQYVQNWLIDSKSNDVKAWDWNFREWMMKIMLATYLDEVDPQRSFSKIMTNWAHCYCRSLYQTSHGVQMVLNNVIGIVKTGSYVTASMNSRLRAVLSCLASDLPTGNWVDRVVSDPCYGKRMRTGAHPKIRFNECITMGDDCNEEETAGTMARYAEMHVRVEPNPPLAEGFSFCSHVFTPSCAVPENTTKSFFNLLMQEVSLSKLFLEQYAFQNRHNPDLPRIVEIFNKSVEGLDVE